MAQTVLCICLETGLTGSDPTNALITVRDFRILSSLMSENIRYIFSNISLKPNDQTYMIQY